MYISELLAAIAASIFYYKYKHLPVKMVLLIVWIAVITEGVARIYSHFYHNNHWVYNLYSFLFYLLFYKMIYDHIKDKTRKRILLALSIAMMGAIIIRAFTVPVITHYMSHAYNIAMLVLILQLMYYAVERLKSDAPLKVKKELELFVFGGYLVFGISFVPLSLFAFGQTGSTYSDELHIVLQSIQTFALVTTNLILIIGFIWTRPEKVTE